MNDSMYLTQINVCDPRYKLARDALTYEILLILLAACFTTFHHQYSIMTLGHLV